MTDIPGAERSQHSFQSIYMPDCMIPWCQLGEDDAEDDSSIEDDADVSMAELLGNLQ